MKDIISTLLAFGLSMGIIGLIILFILCIVVGFACLYYGAILFALLTILKWFGVIGLVGVM